MNKRQRKKSAKQYAQRIIDKQNVINFMIGVYELIGEYTRKINPSIEGKGRQDGKDIIVFSDFNSNYGNIILFMEAVYKYFDLNTPQEG